jgi:GDP-L-fucose synthase
MFNWFVKSKPRPRKVIYFSSSAAYPISKQTPESHLPLSEDMIDLDCNIGVPDMTYGWAKLTGEFLARYAAAKYELDVAVYRPFSGYGEDQDLTYPFPSIIRRVAMEESPLVIWGSGDQLRDFIHIDDVVEAVLASCFRIPPAMALNLGSGTGTSFRMLMKLACDVAGHCAPIINDPTKPEGVFARVGDCTRMQSFYTPRISLEEGVERAYAMHAATVAESAAAWA